MTFPSPLNPVGAFKVKNLSLNRRDASPSRRNGSRPRATIPNPQPARQPPPQASSVTRLASRVAPGQPSQQRCLVCTQSPLGNRRAARLAPSPASRSLLPCHARDFLFLTRTKLACAFRCPAWIDGTGFAQSRNSCNHRPFREVHRAVDLPLMLS